MMGTLDSHQEQSLFSYHIHLDRRIRPDHPLRQLHAALDLTFVVPAVQDLYGRSGNVSLDPRVILKMMLLLFYYDIPSERELVAQIGERLDFLWFLGFDLETTVPDHSVLSKARARWGAEVFDQLFTRVVLQCVQAGLVDGRLVHVDSTIVKANASKNSILQTSPEMVAAVRAACQKQSGKLAVLAPVETAAPVPVSAVSAPVPVLPGPQAGPPPSVPKLPVNQTHISLTDPEAHLARSKNGVTDLTYKEHRAVDDAHGVITAVAVTISTVADGKQLPALVQQHQDQTGLGTTGLTLAGDKHYGTAENYLYCVAQHLRPHLGEASAHLEERGKLPLSQFTYEAGRDRYRCPQGHYLTLHQLKPEAQAKVYLIEQPDWCAACPQRARCTSAKRGRSLQRHVQAEVIARAQTEARSPAGRYSRKRRKHVMEGSFADAANNHGSKRARWRGLARQQIQSWLICVCQNLRLLVKHRRKHPPLAAGVVTVLPILAPSDQMVPRKMENLPPTPPNGNAASRIDVFLLPRHSGASPLALLSFLAASSN